MVGNEILRVVNGSRLYGTSTDTSDEDFVAIYVEEPRHLFLGTQDRTRKLHDRPEGQRTQSGEVDGQAYSVRHFMHLTADGGPSQILILFAPDDMIVSATPFGMMLLDARDKFISQRAAPRFKGYLLNQKLRLRGEKGGHIPNRPELVEQFGYDTKYAGHVVRLALQGTELMDTGALTLPMPEHQRNMVLNVRNGMYDYEQCLELVDQLEAEMLAAIDDTDLPPEPDWQGLASLSRVIHEGTWESADYA